MKWFLMLLVVVLAGCKGPVRVKQQLQYAGGDGSSCERAVVISGARFRETGLAGQQIWLQQQYPGYRKTNERLVAAANKRFQEVELTTVDGRNSSVYFDVTDWWEK